MSKGPDLSAFPIPRKGGARPIGMQGTQDVSNAPGSGGGDEEVRLSPAEHSAAEVRASNERPGSRPEPTVKRRLPAPVIQQAPSATLSGQLVATTVKLDEDRYLRLVNAGQPAPGRLKRRTIQEMMVEAIDEWFNRRGL